MSTVPLEPVELRARGFDALVRSLGWVNAVRFMQQFEPSRLNYVNERDAILKERAYGLTPAEGNHGEDVKEYYFYLDSTPTHSYMKYLY